MVDVGGIVLDSFRIVFGNADIMFIILTWSIFLAIALTSIAIYQYIRR